MGNPGRDEVRRAYDTVAADYARLLPDTRAEAPLDLAMVDAFVEQVRAAGEVLDAGCGAGRMTRYLTDRGCTVVGVDLSPGMVESGRRAHPDLTLSVASLHELPFAGGHLLVGFQAGEGSQDLSEAYARQGHDVELARYRRTADEMAGLLTAARTEEVARLVRAPAQPWEDDDQAALLVRRRPPHT